MKKNILISFLIFAYTCFANNVYAQDGYTYTLQHNGGYSFTVQAVPNASSSNFATSVQSYGFTIVLPDGVTITAASSLGGAASATFFDGNNVALPTIDGYLVTETLGSPISLSAPSAGTNSDIFTFTVNSNPTSGELKILENNSALATTVTPLKSFMQADMINDGSAQFVNVVDPNAAAVSGMSTFDFATLSTTDIEFIENEVKLYPNPTSSIINIQMNTGFKKAEIYTIQGQKIKESSAKNIDVSALSNGIYIIKIVNESGTFSNKYLIKN
ncbi:MAG: T9SS type A sorting domain-containing protein [Kordia sp.]|uniref:T9SS type A sorting domain-containing protein n=1 Tax=Kordia sp. TaxID=1965332 RepID=UPI00385CB6B7